MNDLVELFRFIKTIPGAISMTEAVALYGTIFLHLSASEEKEALAADLGSHMGKSACVALAAFQELLRDTSKFCVVDLLYDRNNSAWQDTVQGSSDKVPWNYANDPNFIRNVMANFDKVCYARPTLYGLSSLQFLEVYGPFSYLFIDTDDHQQDLVVAETKLIEDKMVPGGLVVFHDFGNQYRGPQIGYRRLLGTGKYEEVRILWEEAEKFVRENDLEKGNDSWHMPGVEFPKYIGVLRRK